MMEIKKIDHNFSVCQVEDYSLVNLNSEYSFIGKTDEEKFRFAKHDFEHLWCKFTWLYNNCF